MWKPIHNTAALATIAASAIAALAYWVPRQSPSAADRREQAPIVAYSDTSAAARELRQALLAAAAISAPRESDLALQHVVRAALTTGKELIAIEAADSISAPGSRDEVLGYIVGLSIKRGKVDAAQHAARLISAPGMHDAALRSVAESLNARHFRP